MPTPAPTPSLCLPSPVAVYRADQADAFRAAVVAQAKFAAVAAVNSPKDLVMAADGSLPGGYRYTPAGLRQVCDLLCNGLYGFVSDISGGPQGHSPVATQYSFVEAVRAYNVAVARRVGARVVDKGVKILRDTRAKTVEGTLGQTYVRIDNSQIYDMAEAAVADVATFQFAVMAGRRMALRYAAKRPLFSVPPHGPVLEPESFRLGFHFANSEVGGECAIRASVLLIRDRDGSASVGKPLGHGRVLHSGRQLGAKLARLFSSINGTSDRENPKWYAAQAEKLIAKNLALPRNGEEFQQRINALVAVLRGHEATKSSAEQAVAIAAASGSYTDRPSGGRQQLEGRTAWDLYNALAATATHHIGASRDRIERVAWRLFTGKIELGADSGR